MEALSSPSIRRHLGRRSGGAAFSRRVCLSPQTCPHHRIGEYGVPEPVREPLECGQVYFIPGLVELRFVQEFSWQGDVSDKLFLRCGLIHLTKEAAVIHAEALLSLTKAA